MARHKCKSMPLIWLMGANQSADGDDFDEEATMKVNMLHYASSLNGETHTSKFSQMDLSQSQQLHLNPNR